MKTIQLTNDDPARIDTALGPLLGVSRSQVQRAIRDGRVFVDGKPATAHMLVSKTSVITMLPVQEPQANERETPPLPLAVLYEDADAVVVNKPAGILSHPAPNTKEHTLVDALVAAYPSMAHIGDSKERAGLVHRLDRDASGVLIAAKTKEAFAHLKRQFAERKTRKTYRVLVLGSVRENVGTITFPIARSATSSRMAARPHSQEGREAITHYEVVERFPHCTLLNVHIETGRTHQIRAHFFALQHPVAGDTLYVQRGQKQFDLGRLFLHAAELTITLPNGEEKTFAAPLPPELQQFLDGLRARHKHDV